MAPQCDRSERPMSWSNSDFVESITVLVGPDEQSFMVHRNIVCATSRFFRAACDRRWKEGLEKLVRLPEAEVEAFKIYCSWLYGGDIELQGRATKRKRSDTDTQPPKYDQGMDENKRDELAFALISAYVLGDMLQDEDFCNSLIDELLVIVRTLNGFMSPQVQVLRLWGNVPQDSKLTAFFVEEWAVGRCPKTEFLKLATSLPQEFVARVAYAGMQDCKTSFTHRYPYNRPKCYYHNHTSDT